MAHTPTKNGAKELSETRELALSVVELLNGYTPTMSTAQLQAVQRALSFAVRVMKSSGCLPGAGVGYTRIERPGDALAASLGYASETDG